MTRRARAIQLVKKQLPRYGRLVRDGKRARPGAVDPTPAWRALGVQGKRDIPYEQQKFDCDLNLCRCTLEHRVTSNGGLRFSIFLICQLLYVDRNAAHTKLKSAILADI